MITAQFLNVKIRTCNVDSLAVKAYIEKNVNYLVKNK